ncbi:MAG: uroporphyrinogen decarboxylase family protein [Chloroflexi bacterium]|nr:uroporphyrinogen decarboxylase family protein [Chloroflexota bacterium]
MDSRERVLRTLNHQEADRAPRYAALMEGVVAEFYRRTGQVDPSVYWDWDIASIGFLPPAPLPDLRARFGRYYQRLQGEWLLDWEHGDYPPEWGVATRPAHFLHFSAPIAPLAHASTPADLADYPFPDYMNEWRHSHLEAQVRQLKQSGQAVCGGAGWIFQSAWLLRSREQLFVDFYENPEFARALLERVTAIRIAMAVRLAEAGVDMLSLSDDIGTQQSMIMSPAMWRAWVKPYFSRLIAAVHRVNPGIHVRYHSDGWYLPVIPDLIEIGVSSLVTVQPESMDVFEIKRRFGRQLTLEGTIGCQGVLMRGAPDELRDHIRRQCAGLMPGGGWIASPGNGVEPDIPWENLVTLFSALDEYSYYQGAR